MKTYTTPKIELVEVCANSILASSQSLAPLEDVNDEITCDVTEYGWQPDTDEKILVCHNKFQIMKNEGQQIGNAFGRTHYIAEALSSQNFICCVTDKRVLLIPTHTRNNTKQIINIGMALSGIDPITKAVTKKIATTILLQNYVDNPIEFSRKDIEGAKISTEFLSPEQPIIVISCKGQDFCIQCQEGIEKALSISASICQPEIFMED